MAAIPTPPGVIGGYLGRLAIAYNSRLQADYAARHAGMPARFGRVELVSRAWFNDNLESPPFYVPAVITNILFVITMLLSSLAIVREKEIGTIEQVIVTPIRKGEFILGKTLPFVLIGYIDVALISGVGALVFDAPVRGSLWLLFLGHDPLPDELPGSWAADFHGQSDSAAGHDDRLLHHLSGHAPVRFCLPDREYA